MELFYETEERFFGTPDTQEGFREDLQTSISYLAIMDKHHATMNAKVIK